MSKILLNKIMFYLISITLMLNKGYGQDLLTNGDFEKGGCPELRNDSIVVCNSWFSVGTADYFAYCSKGEVNPLQNFMGSRKPYSGDAYVGIFSGKGITNDLSEILYTEILHPLEKGKKYKFRMMYSLANNAELISKSLGVAFSENLAYEIVDSPFGIGHVQTAKLNYVIFDTDINKLSNDRDWNLLEQEYVALGGEKYLYISGVPIKGVSCVRRNDTSHKYYLYTDYAYYYIDNVSLIEEYTVAISSIEKEGFNTKNENYIPPNIYFSSNSYQLDNEFKLKLDTLLIFMQKHPSWKISITGYTDTIGTEKNNLILSEKRALAVEKYLLLNKLEESRIFLQARGSSMPNGSNALEEGRSINRRVELLLIHNDLLEKK